MMAVYTGRFNRDGNGTPIKGSYDAIVTKIRRTYTGAAGLGAVGTTNLATITGIILLRSFGVCITDLTGASATIANGVTTNTTAFGAATTATNIDAGMIWASTAPANIFDFSAQQRICIAGNMIETIAAANITGGVLDVYCLWTPITSDGNFVPLV